MTFEFVGKISLPKETDKFKPYEENTFQNKWLRKRLRFSVNCGDDRNMVQLESFNANDNTGDVLVFSKGDGDKKGEQFRIPFSERLTSSRLSEVADFKKLVIDLGNRKRRYDLQKLVEKINNSEVITDDEMNSVGCHSEAEIKKAYEDSLKLRKEYIAEVDYIDFIKKVLDSGKYAEKKFRITGNVEHSYNAEKGTVYTSYIPQKMYLMDDDAEFESSANIKFLFGADSLEKDEENKKMVIHGWTMSYERQMKKQIPVDIDVVVPANDEKKASVIAKRFSVDTPEEIREMGIEVRVVNGSSRMEITEDMLTPEQKELLDLGFVTMDELRAELGGNARGESIRELRLKGFTRGYTSGSQSTAYGPSDMRIGMTQEESDAELDSLFDI